MEEKKFERPELIIISFSGELATDDILSTSSGIGDVDFDDLQ